MPDTAVTPARPRLWPRRVFSLAVIGLWGLALFAVWRRDVAPLAARGAGAGALHALFARPEGTQTRFLWMDDEKVGNLSNRVEHLGPSSRLVVDEGDVRIDTQLPLLGAIRATVTWGLESYYSRAIGLRYLQGEVKVQGLPSLGGRGVESGPDRIQMEMKGWRRGGDLEIDLVAHLCNEEGEPAGDPLYQRTERVPFDDRSSLGQPFSPLRNVGSVRVGQRWTDYLVDPMEMPTPRPRRMTFEVTEKVALASGGEAFRVTVQNEHYIERGRVLVSSSGEILEAEMRPPLLMGLSTVTRAIPRIDRVSPQRGPAGGGTVVVIEGAHFIGVRAAGERTSPAGPPVVTFGGLRAKLRPGWTGTRLEVETPAFRFSEESGKDEDACVHVRVSSEDGEAQREELFTYERPPPGRVP